MTTSKNLRVGVALVAVALLAACGRAADVSNDGSSSASPNEAATTTEAAESTPADSTPVHLTVWGMGTDGDNLPELIAQYTAAHPDVTVDVTSVPWQDAAAKLRTAIAGGVAPDIAQVGTTLMGGITDGFQPVPSTFDTSIYFQGTLASAKVGGTLVGVPWVVDPRALYYRTDLATAAGFDGPPTTWEELEAEAKGMQTAGAEWGLRFSTTPDQELQNALYFPWSNGAQIINDDFSQWTFDTPEAAEAYAFYQKLFTEGISDPNADAGAGAAESAFVNGQLGMLVAGAGESKQLVEAGGADFASKFAVATFPKNKSATGFVGGSNLVVFKSTKSADAAWDLIAWLSQPEVQVQWYQTAGGLPAVESAWQDSSLAGDKNLAVFGEQLKDTNSPPPVATWLEVADAFGQQMDQVVKAGKDPAQALKDLQAQADQIGTGN